MRRAFDHLPVIGAALLPVAVLPGAAFADTTLRLAIAVPLAAAGLAALVGAAMSRSHRLPAALGLAYLAVAALATARASHPLLALWGGSTHRTGLLFEAAVVGCWALAATAPGPVRRRVALAAVGAIGVNALVGAAQGPWDLTLLGLPTSGRSTGLTGNAVHLGALCAAGLALVAPRLGDPRISKVLGGAAATVAIAAGLQLSGSRAALVAGAIAALATAVVAAARRGERPRRRIAAVAAVVVAVACGLAAGSALAPGAEEHRSGEVVAAPTASTGRVTAGASEGLEIRSLALRAGRRSLIERPLLGVGPSRFEQAGAGEHPRAAASITRSVPDDAHNALVERAVTTGFPGMGLFGGFLVAALAAVVGRRADLAIAGTAILAVEMLQPQSLATTPVAMLLLGSAAAHARTSRSVAALGAVGALAGAVVAASLVAAAWQLEQGRLDAETARMASAARRLPPWPAVTRRLAELESFTARAEDDERARARALAYAEETVKRDPSVGPAWGSVGERLLVAGRPARAAACFAEALRRDARLPGARTGLAAALDELGRPLEAEAWRTSGEGSSEATPPGSRPPAAAGPGAAPAPATGGTAHLPPCLG